VICRHLIPSDHCLHCLRQALADEREACARTVERARLQLDGRHGLTNETDHIATRIVEFLAAAVRARGDA
jgi:hypothetical protein